jgi:hypothetical protein
VNANLVPKGVLVSVFFFCSIKSIVCQSLGDEKETGVCFTYTGVVGHELCRVQRQQDSISRLVRQKQLIGMKKMKKRGKLVEMSRV